MAALQRRSLPHGRQLTSRLDFAGASAGCRHRSQICNTSWVGCEIMPGVLEGIRVLDFGRYIAGPYCAALLAEQGAEVIRIEKREGSEDRYQAPVAETGEGALFLQMNRNKLGLTLDPMRPEGQEIVRKLVATADVVVANLPPQTLEDMKLDYASLTAVKPDIILTTVTAYGRGGPYSDRVGFDGIGQAMSGAVYMTGDGGPALPRAGALGRLRHGAALRVRHHGRADGAQGHRQGPDGGRRAAGHRRHLRQRAADRAGGDRSPTACRRGTAARRRRPVDIFRTKDGWILVQVIGAAAVQALGQADGRGALAHRSALQGRHLARRQRRGHQRAHEPLVRASARPPRRSRSWPRPRSRRARSTSRSRRWTTRTSRRWASSSRPSSRARRKPAPIAKAPVWLSETPGSIRRRAADAGRAHRPDPGQPRLRQEGDRGAAAEGRGLDAPSSRRLSPGSRHGSLLRRSRDRLDPASTTAPG